MSTSFLTRRGQPSSDSGRADPIRQFSRTTDSPRDKAYFALSRGPNWLRVTAEGLEGSALRHHGWLYAPANRPVPVTLVDPTLEFRWEHDGLEPHGDVIAAATIFAFFPLLARSPVDLTFDWGVSERFATGLGLLPASLRLTGDAHGNPLDPAPGQVLSYGGGFDSLSMVVLYPEARPVFEAPLSVLDGRLTSAVKESSVFRDSDGIVLYTNQRSLYDKWGVGSWPSVLTAAAFVGAGTIVTGLNAMDNAYLVKGLGFQDPRTSVDQRFLAFLKQLGFRIVQTMWKSEVTSTHILQSAGLVDQAAYCGRIPLFDCGGCFKCLRRRILKALAIGHPSPLSGFEPWAGTVATLQTSPLEWGHIFALAHQRRLLPEWLSSLLAGKLDDFGSLDFLERFYAPAFLPSEVAAREISGLISALESHGVRSMDPGDQILLHSFR